MRILVTGGAGFIGSHIVDAYIKAGHKVWVVDNERSGKKENVNPMAAYRKMDFTNYTALRKIFQRGRFDAVNHHGAQIDVRLSVEHPHFDAKVNINGTLNLLELSREYEVKKFIFSSSGGTVYGECRKPAPESTPTDPLSPYGVSKLASEKYIQTYGANFGVKYTIFRYANVYGPRQDPFGEAGVVAIFSNHLLRNRRPLIFGSGKQTRDFVFVGDVVRANLKALVRAHNQVINIGTQKETSVNELYDCMADITGFDETALHKPQRRGELLRSVLNIGKARKILGWAPKTSLRNGLKETVSYFSTRIG